MNFWDFEQIEIDLNEAYKNNSETELLKILKNNSFLFYDLYFRKYGICPLFSEISFGDTYRCDFAWLNDNSCGPEWTLVEVEKPAMPLFTKSGEPTAQLNHAIGQLESWERYFEEHPTEKQRIFGAVARFRFILVAGSSKEWSEEYAQRWRTHRQKKQNIEIRSSDTFLRSIKIAMEKPDEMWSFKDQPIALTHKDLSSYFKSSPYIGHFRKIIN